MKGHERISQTDAGIVMIITRGINILMSQSHIVARLRLVIARIRGNANTRHMIEWRSFMVSYSPLRYARGKYGSEEWLRRDPP